MTSEAQRRAAERYHEKNVLHVSLNLNRRTEPELCERMEKGADEMGSKAAYLKHLIRRDIRP